MTTQNIFPQAQTPQILQNPTQLFKSIAISYLPYVLTNGTFGDVTPDAQNTGWLEMRNLVDGLHTYNPASHLEKVIPVGVPCQKPLEGLDDAGSRTVKPMTITAGK